MLNLILRIRRLWEDKTRPVLYPGHYSRGDAIMLNNYYRIADRRLVLNTPDELQSWVMASPTEGVPTRQERGWMR
jgi:hypothetical protein